MPLQRSKGNMYPWVTHTHTHLGGECPHHCSYCYVDNPRFGRAPRYRGPVRLIPEEFHVRYDRPSLERDGGKYPGVIFVEHKNDIAAAGTPLEFVEAIMRHCRQHPENDYVFQSKDPRRLKWSVPHMPPKVILGTTIESNRHYPDVMRDAPPPASRFMGMLELKASYPGVRTFVTIEPVLDFDVDVLADWIAEINPTFINLGADSKGHNLTEPTVAKIHELVDVLHDKGIELREKHNLAGLASRQGAKS